MEKCHKFLCSSDKGELAGTVWRQGPSIGMYHICHSQDTGAMRSIVFKKWWCPYPGPQSRRARRIRITPWSCLNKLFSGLAPCGVRFQSGVKPRDAGFCFKQRFHWWNALLSLNKPTGALLWVRPFRWVLRPRQIEHSPAPWGPHGAVVKQTRGQMTLMTCEMGSSKFIPLVYTNEMPRTVQRLPIGALLLESRSLQTAQLPFSLSALLETALPHPMPGSWFHTSDHGLSPWKPSGIFHSKVSLWLTRKGILPSKNQYRRRFYHRTLCPLWYRWRKF